MVQLGYEGQRLAHRAAKQVAVKFPGIFPEKPALTTGHTPISRQIVHFVARPLPKVELKQTMRELLGIEKSEFVPIIRNPNVSPDDLESVFYFPGCGSERLFSEIGMATLAMLYEANAQTVLPPGYLCCGYPQTAGGNREKGAAITTENRVLFHRIANTLNYLDIKTVVVSCGTCMDQLLKYEFGKIFPGSRLLDVHEYLMEKGVQLRNDENVKYLYHDPCHSPMKTHEPSKVVSSILNAEVLVSDRCCGEAGTLAVSRPDISSQIRYRKAEELIKGISELGGGEASTQKIQLVTACPSCQQGLSRYQQETGMDPSYPVVLMAKKTLGDGWVETFVQRMKNGGLEQVLL